MAGWGVFVLRLATGAVFVAHGAQKLFGIWGGSGLSGYAGFLTELGLEPAFPLAVLVGVVEFVGGLMLIAGAWTTAAALPLIVVMLGATWFVHLPHGFFLASPGAAGRGHGIEFVMMLTAALACLAFAGGGELSVDRFRNRNAELAALGRERLRSM